MGFERFFQNLHQAAMQWSSHCELQGLRAADPELTEWSTQIPQRNELQLRNKSIACVWRCINHGYCSIWECGFLEWCLCLPYYVARY